jgi:hypothetical protein
VEVLPDGCGSELSNDTPNTVCYYSFEILPIFTID